jgi:hypothetical protein
MAWLRVDPLLTILVQRGKRGNARVTAATKVHEPTGPDEEM